jgi:hypothetical protein
MCAVTCGGPIKKYAQTWLKVLHQRIRVDWDQKASATFHTKIFQKVPKIPLKGPFLTYCVRDCKGLGDIYRIALWPVSGWSFLIFLFLICALKFLMLSNTHFVLFLLVGPIGFIYLFGVTENYMERRGI